jgi:hypothetical protein
MCITGLAHRMISSTADAQPLEVGLPLAFLVGILRERPHALADGGARGLVAGGDQQEEERPEVFRRHRLAVDLGVHERRRAIIFGVKPRFTTLRSLVCFGGSVEIIDRMAPMYCMSSGSVITWMP